MCPRPAQVGERVRAVAAQRRRAVSEELAELRRLVDAKEVELLAGVQATEVEQLALVEARERADDRTLSLAHELEAATAAVVGEPDHQAFAMGFADLQPGLRRVLEAPTSPVVPEEFGCRLETTHLAAALGTLGFA